MELAELTSKVKQVSQKYQKNYNIKPDDSWYILKLQEELGELIQAFLMVKKKARRKNKSDKELKQDFDGEVADVLGHILLLADHFGVDLETVMKEKWMKWLE